VGDGVGVVGIPLDIGLSDPDLLPSPLSDPLDSLDSLSSEVGDSKIGKGGRGKSNVASSSLASSRRAAGNLRRQSASSRPCTAVNSGDVCGIERSETPSRLFAFMLFFFVFFSVDFVLLLSGTLLGSSTMLERRAVPLRITRDWRLIYEETIPPFIVRTEPK
jgi:hypothetical protein